ncbi:MAG: helix-turn-helix domain-containing protein [Pirellulales bacterium]
MKPSMVDDRKHETTVSLNGHGPVEHAADDAGHVHCPAGAAIDLVAHKWTVHILFSLHNAGEPLRFRKLQQLVRPITQKELTKRLRELERSGLVHRQIFAEVPPRVEYRLSELGRTLMPALTALSDWASRYGATIEAHRRSATH